MALSEPPSDLNDRDLPLAAFSGRTWRCHRVVEQAIQFGCSAVNRFDAPDCSYGVLYVAESPEGAFAEVFLRDTAATQFIKTALGYSIAVSAASLAAYGIASVEIGRSLNLVDLRGPGPLRVGADHQLTTTDNYALTQRWGYSLFAHPQRPDGILWHSRVDDRMVSLAIHERAGDAIAASATESLLSPQLLQQIDARYQLAIV